MNIRNDMKYHYLKRMLKNFEKIRDILDSFLE
jgi:hypothetical protein